MSHEIGSVEVGKLADLVLWRPAFFGVKPELVLKGGFIAWAQMGDAERVDPDAAAARACGRCSARSAAPSGATSLAFVSQRARSRRAASRARARQAPRRRCAAAAASASAT